MRTGHYSHPGKRSNPEQHGTVARFDQGCGCWRCQNAALKDAKMRVQLADHARRANNTRIVEAAMRDWLWR